MSKAQTAQDAVDKAKAEATRKSPSGIAAKSAKLRFLNTSRSRAKTVSQKFAIHLADLLSKNYGMRFVIFESKVAEDGRRYYIDGGKRIYEGANGWFSGDVIHIDLNAGAAIDAEGNTRKTMAETLSHEIYHFAKVYSPKLAQEYAEFLFDNWGTEGITLEQAIRRQMDAAEDAGHGLASREAALEEVVSESTVRMFADTNAASVLAEFAAQSAAHGNFVKKIAEHIKKVVADIVGLIDRYRKVVTDTVESAHLQTLSEDVRKELGEKWQAMLFDAVNTYSDLRATGTKISASQESELANVGIGYDAPTRSVLRSAPITKNDVDNLRSIPRKSINSFTSEEIKKTEPWARKFYAELGTKSPFFRAWFGDWRAHDTKEIAYVPVNTDFVGNGAIPHGDFYNKDTEWNVFVRSNGIEKTKSQMGVGSKEHRVLTDLKMIIDNAVLHDTIVADKPSKKMGATAVFVHHLYCPITMNGRKALAKLYISEHIDGGHKFYLTKIEEVSHTIGKSTNEGAAVHRAEGTAGDTSPTISISEIFSLVKALDKNFEADSKNPVLFKPKDVSPLMLNDDGTPKELYHGTDADFTVFDMAKGRANMDIQGAFFSPYEEDSAGYGSKVGAFYLNLKNPADEATAFKALNKYKGQNKAGAKAREYLIQQGYDGVFNGYDEYIAFYPEQIKSATDNIGTFDGKNPDTLYQEREIDNRTLLANALDSVAQNENETKILADYKAKIAAMNAQEHKLAKLKEDIKVAWAEGLCKIFLTTKGLIWHKYITSLIF